jgi:hypothetical protein
VVLSRGSPRLSLASFKRSSGTEVGRIFIENSRHHAALIASAIERRLRPVAI